MNPTPGCARMFCVCPCPHCRSKADEVTDERDRQRVLIQITQNLATRIRNSHAFNLPTFYLPHEDDGGLPCSIPNAIEDVCEQIDKVGRGGGKGRQRPHVEAVLARVLQVLSARLCTAERTRHLFSGGGDQHTGD